MSYQTLFAVFKDQPRDEVFAGYHYNKDIGETWETPYQRLAQLATPEQWSFNSNEFQRPGFNFPILQNYLKNTFLRLLDEKKVFFSTDGQLASFNTGLLTKDEKEIFGLFAPHVRRQEGFPDWFLAGFVDSYSQRMSAVRPLPPLASYISDAADLVFDTKYDIDVNVGHMLDEEDNRQRLPIELRGNRTLALHAIEGAVKLIRAKVARNYKTAIPMWYLPERRIQLLLPLFLTRDDAADLALVADKDQAARLYRIRTALTMDMAYINARLLTRPDREWLNP